MTSTGFEVFDETIQKTNTLLKTIETELGWANHRKLSYAALRSVLHALRDRLAIQESAQLTAQLPLLVRGIYYEGWDPSVAPKKLDKDAFIEEVRRGFPYSTNLETADLITAVLKALQIYVSKGELNDVFAELPKDLSALLKQL
jgi:uncharacterized protein (DUF2267 family)